MTLMSRMFEFKFIYMVGSTVSQFVKLVSWTNDQQVVVMDYQQPLIRV